MLWLLLVPLPLCWVFLLALTPLVLVLRVHCYTSRTPVEWRPVQTAGSELSRLVWQPRCKRKNKTIVINFWYRRTTKQTNLTQIWLVTTFLQASEVYFTDSEHLGLRFRFRFPLCFALFKISEFDTNALKHCWQCCTSCVHVRCFSCDMASSISKLRIASSESATYKK